MAAKNDNITKNPSEAGKKGNKRVKKRKTIIKEKLGLDNIEGMKEDVLNVWNDLITEGTKKEKMWAAKEMSKYIFPQKREHSGEIKEKITVTINYA